MNCTVHKFWEEREELNDTVMKYAGTVTRRFYSLDTQAYREGKLSVRTKELLGLVASFVLRCDDCIRYHVIRCHQEGVTSEELEEALSIAVMVGGTITIPHLRKAYRTWDELLETEGSREGKHKGCQELEDNNDRSEDR